MVILLDHRGLEYINSDSLKIVSRMDMQCCEILEKSIINLLVVHIVLDMNIGYFADGPWAHKALERIVKLPRVTIKFICGRVEKTDEILRSLSTKYNIPFLLTNDINSPDFLKNPLVNSCDLFVSMSFNQIFRKISYNLPPLGTINCHAGKLPYYRGRNVLNWVLINDEKEFGITVHYVDEGIDTGDIIRQKCFNINEEDTYKTLLESAYSSCAELLSLAVCDILNGNINRKSQNSISPLGLLCTGRGPGDEKLNWQQNSRDIFNFVRAISFPGPGATCYLNNNEVKINKLKFFTNAPVYKGIPGSILAKHGNGFLVKTKDSYVYLTDWESHVPLRVGDRFT